MFTTNPLYYFPKPLKEKTTSRKVTLLLHGMNNTFFEKGQNNSTEQNMLIGNVDCFRETSELKTNCVTIIEKTNEPPNKEKNSYFGQLSCPSWNYIYRCEYY